MSQETVIRVFNLGKLYRLGHTLAMTTTFRERLMRLPSDFRRAIHPCPASLSETGQNRESSDSFWALESLNFEVRRGDVMGIIGRNGAGKSTLLKILSRITRPTKGRVEMEGSVRSLLEVGTGFHPELTGRENIYLNGAVLGMRKAEIVRKFDEIVAFSEIERFLDTPVKRYSSGMYVKLAFAVAAHMDSEILLVDEVLAVGDLQFQRKCLGKVQEMSSHGRTVLFVSHNMQVLRRICGSGIYLKEGRIVDQGDIEGIIARYVDDIPQTRTMGAIPPELHSTFPPGLEIFRVELLNQRNDSTGTLRVDETFTLRLYYRVHDFDQRFRIGIVWRNSDGILLATVISTIEELPWLRGDPDRRYRLVIEGRNPFLPGSYTLDVVIRNFQEEVVDTIQGLPVEVENLSTATMKSFSFGHIRLETRLYVDELDYSYKPID